MKLEQFRKSAELVSAMKKLFEDPFFKAVIEMLEDEHPRKKEDLGFGVAVFDIARLHDRQTGYELVLANMRKATEFIQPTTEVKQDYEKTS